MSQCVLFPQPVAMFPFEEFNAPPFELIKPFCVDMEKWYAQNPKNVAVVHCVSGKVSAQCISQVASVSAKCRHRKLVATEYLYVLSLLSTPPLPSFRISPSCLLQGRTGLMICAYLLYNGEFQTTTGALDFFEEARTTNRKVCLHFD